MVGMTVHAIKARYVFPVSTGPIANCLVGIRGKRIAAVGQRVTADTVEDLGNVAILPGLVNAHTHLEFSNLTKPLGEPGIGLVDWIRLIRREPLEVRVQAVKTGIRECLRFGTTAMGEIVQGDFPASELENENMPADGTAFLELIAPTADRIPAALDLARARIKDSRIMVQDSVGCVKRTNETVGCVKNTNETVGCVKRTDNRPNWQLGLSPHAPYSVHLDLLQKIIELSVHGQIPLAMHLAESREEIQWLDDGNGPFNDLLMELGTGDPSAVLRCSRPLDYLEMLAVAHRALIIHGNYLTRDEIGLLSDHAETMAAVYCPRSHQYFGHDRYPLERMLSAGATVCLGTDSRASAPDLDLLAEIRHVARHYPALDPEIVLRLGALQGAKALGRDAEIGSLEPGKYANLAIVPLPDSGSDDPYELLFDSDESATETWFRGKRIYG
jgi:cytosine/adenosine deaminase-related metal-dependent hydrolase